jgi:2-polyprenyl-3-methyl-5-hydroxy-6-metoxy-1,4-benzoquinol methylase
MKQVPCRLCGCSCAPIQQESRGRFVYLVVRCSSCQTVQVADHFHDISPDYSTLSLENIEAKHIEMGRAHKYHAYAQFSSLLQKHVKSITSSISICDVGCGTGGFVEYASSIYGRVFGYDASQGQVEHCRLMGLDVECAKAADELLLLRPDIGGCCNVVTLWDVLEHIREPMSFITGLRSLLAENGMLFVSVPSAGGHRWKRPIYRLARKTYSFDPWEHVFYYTPQSLQKLLAFAGFVTVEYGAVRCYRRPLSSLEMLRRCAHAGLSSFHSLAPQIYILARKEPLASGSR